MTFRAVQACLATLAACAQATPQQMPAMSMSSSPAPSATEAVATDTVSIKDFAFAPASVTVKAGTTVTWTNSDTEPHTVTSANGPLKSPTMNTGDKYTYTFSTPGRYDYLCTIHPFMTATVVVTP
jgi:amicyanin